MAKSSRDHIVSKRLRSLRHKLLGPWAAEILDPLSAEPPGRLLDLACGTGTVYTEARRRWPNCEIIAADLSLPPSSNNSGIHVIRCDAHFLPFPTGIFGSVACLQGLQFFYDIHTAVGQTAFVLARGGQLTAATWSGFGGNPIAQTVSAAIAEFFGNSAREQYARPWRVDPLFIPIFEQCGYFQLASAHLVTKPLEVTFADLLESALLPHIVPDTITVAKRALFAELLRAHLQPFMCGRIVRAEMASRVLIARRV